MFTSFGSWYLVVFCESKNVSKRASDWDYQLAGFKWGKPKLKWSKGADRVWSWSGVGSWWFIGRWCRPVLLVAFNMVSKAVKSIQYIGSQKVQPDVSLCSRKNLWFRYKSRNRQNWAIFWTTLYTVKLRSESIKTISLLSGSDTRAIRAKRVEWV